MKLFRKTLNIEGSVGDKKFKAIALFEYRIYLKPVFFYWERDWGGSWHLIIAGIYLHKERMGDINIPIF